MNGNAVLGDRTRLPKRGSRAPLRHRSSAWSSRPTSWPCYLREALASVVAEPYRNLEIVLHDECEPDHPAPPWPRSPFAHRSLPQRAQSRMTPNLAAGLAKCTGKYVAILGDDDLWQAEFVALLVTPGSTPSQAVVAFCDHDVVDENGKIAAPLSHTVTHRFGRDTLAEGMHRPFAEIALKRHSICVMSAALLRREAANWADLPAEVSLGADLYIAYLAARTGGACYFVRRRLMHYRYHRNSLATASSTTSNTASAMHAPPSILEPLSARFRHRRMQALFRDEARIERAADRAVPVAPRQHGAALAEMRDFPRRGLIHPRIPPGVASAPRARVNAVKILLHGLNYKPELIGVGKYSGEMAEWLAAQGHDVRVVTSYPYYPQWRVADAYRGRLGRSEKDAGVRLVRCPLTCRGGRARRCALHLSSFALSSAPVLLWQALAWRPDVIVGIEPTLFAAPWTLAAARLAGAVAWLHVQDFEIEAAVATGLVASARLARAGSRLKPRCCGASTASDHFPGDVRPCRREGRCIRADRAPVELGGDRQAPPARQPFAPAARARHPAGDGGALRRQYEREARSRNAGRRRARRAGDGDFRFGLRRRRRAGAGSRRCVGLGNVTFLPLQPAERLNDLSQPRGHPSAAAAARRRGPGDASKLLGMMSSGRPVVAAPIPLCPGQGSGELRPCRDAGGWRGNGRLRRTLADDRARRAALGAAGRSRVIAEWSRDAVLGEFLRRLAETLLRREMARGGVLSRVTGSSD